MPSLRILLVDDNEAVRRGIRSLLSSDPRLSVCGEAADGVEAVEKAKELHPDAVLMDIAMPRMDGLEATRAIRRAQPEIKIIIVSQNDPAPRAGRTTKVLAHDHVGKINLSRDLIPAIERVFNYDSAEPSAEEPSADSGTRALPWLSDTSEMGTRMRATDWSQMPLGPAESWSPALRMMVKFLLANRFPQLLWWGPQFCSLYNDAYVPILGAKHPWALGQPVSEVWGEIWHILRPLVETPFHGGPATWMEDIPLEINRSGFAEETHFTVAYSPVPDDSVPSGIGGVLATVHEITQKVIADRRVVALRDLGARSVEPKSAEEACTIAAETLARYPKDIPFVLLYLLDENRESAQLVCGAAVDLRDRGCPRIVDVTSSAPQQQWPLSRALETEQIQLVENIASKFENIPAGPWPDPPSAAAVVPIRSNISHQLAGFMIAGISSRLQFDDNYRDFLELMSTQIATTISNARAYEEERKRAAALAEIDRLKTAFFSNVSHEFRTPLTLMLGPLQDLLARSGSNLSPIDKEQLDLVNRNGARLLRLVNTLLDFSRIEAGRVRAVYQATDLASLTSELASVFRSAMERAGLRLVVDCREIGEPVYVDHDMWEKIVLNLLSNAFKFTFDGEIAVSLERVGNTAELRVRDTGVGIPHEAMPKLFERFHRVPDTRSRTYEGSGIGLALVQELAKLHGGSVQVESWLRQGTTFTVSVPLGRSHLPQAQIGGSPKATSAMASALPFVEEALRWLPNTTSDDAKNVAPQRDLAPAISVPTANIASSDPSLGQSSPHPRVIIADDNSDMRQYLARLLADRFDVETVADGEAALEAARKRAPDLILSDVMIPKLDGLGLLRELRADPLIKEIPIILLSARAGEESRLEGVEAGADDYMVKPFSARELTARVEAHVKMYRMRQQAKLSQQLLIAEAVEATAKFRAVFEQTTVFAGIMTNDGVMVEANRLCLDSCGYRADEVLGKLFWQTPWWRNFKESREKICTATPLAAQGIPYREILHYSWADGTDRIVDFALYPIRDDEGRVLFLHPTGVDITDIKRAEENYRNLAESLDAEVRARTGQLEEQNVEVVRQSELLRDFSQRLMQAQDEERRRIARELHDSSGQTLTALSIQAERIAERLKAAAPDLVKDMEEVQALTAQLNQELRTTSYLLHPPMLDEFGITGALQWYIEGFTARSGIEMQLEIDKNLERFPSDTEMAVFRIVQEALTNIHRHSGSKKGRIRIDQKQGELHVEIQDSGKGMSAEKLSEIRSGGAGVGLRGMRERVHQLHGRITVESNASGTRLCVTFPLLGADAHSATTQAQDLQLPQFPARQPN